MSGTTAPPEVIVLMLVGGGAAFLALRLYSIWPVRQQGGDAYVFLMCAEAFRRSRRLPIRLPKLFLLEPQEQWYPPLFAMFCAALPQRVLRRGYWALNHALDLVLWLLLTGWVAWHHGAPLAIAAGIAYAANPGLVMEYRGMSSRPLGGVLFVGFLVASHYAVAGSLAAGALAAIFGTMLLYAHKLTVQLLWFLVPFFALVDGNALWLAPLAVSYLLALAIGRGYFIMLLRAHWDIVSFWSRNWPLLGAHQVRESPVYGDGTATPNTFYGQSWRRNAVRYAKELANHNIFILPVLLALPSYPQMQPHEKFLIAWVIGTYIWAAATLYVPRLRGLGLGTQYVKYAVLPSLAVTAAWLARTGQLWPWLVVLLCLALVFRSYVRTVRVLRQSSWSNSAVVSPEFETMIETIRALDDPRILCLPLHMSESVAFHARQPVLWGTHGYGFRMVEPIFPVLRLRLDDIAREYGATHLLLDRRYASMEEVQLEAEDVVGEAGDLVLLRLTPPLEPVRGAGGHDDAGATSEEKDDG